MAFDAEYRDLNLVFEVLIIIPNDIFVVGNYERALLIALAFFEIIIYGFPFFATVQFLHAHACHITLNLRIIRFCERVAIFWQASGLIALFCVSYFA